MIKCNSCDYDNETEAKFCGRCGASLLVDRQTAVSDEVQTFPAEPTVFSPEPTAAPVKPEIYSAEPAIALAEPDIYPAEPAINPDEPAITFAEPEIALAEPENALAEPDIYPAEPVAATGEPVVATFEFGSVDNKKMLPIIIFAAVLTLIAIIAVVVLWSGSNSKSGNVWFFHEIGKTVLAYGDGSSDEISGEYYSSQLSLDNSKAAILMDYDWRDGSTLYYASASGGVVKIASGVYHYVVSDTGDGVIYWVNYDMDENSAELRVYTEKGSKTIDHDVYLDPYNITAVISPDGKTVVYCKGYYYDEVARDVTWTALVSVDGEKGTSLNGRNGNKMSPVAVSDGGKYIYYFTGAYENISLYVKSDNEYQDLNLDFNSNYDLRVGDSPSGSSWNSNNSTQLFSIFDTIFFNRDYSQVVYIADNGAYIVINGAQRSKISTVNINFFLTRGSEYYKTFTNSHARYVFGFDSFKTRSFYTDNNIYILSKDYEPEKVCRFEYGFNITLSDNGKWIYFAEIVSDGGYSLRRVAAKPDSDKDVVAKNLISPYSFVITKDGENVYYVNNERELKLKSGSTYSDDIGENIAADIDAYFLSISGSDTVFFMADCYYYYTEGMENSNDYSGQLGTLYCVKGNKRTKVKSDVYYVYVWFGAAHYYIMDDDDITVFMSSGDEKFKQLTKYTEQSYSTRTNTTVYYDDEYLE